MEQQQETPNTAQEVPTNGQIQDNAEQSNETVAEPESDLFKRVSEFQNKNAPEVKTEQEIDSDLFSDPKLREKIDAIEDPELRGYFAAMRKSGITGINGKMQEIAEIRKELQSLKQDNDGFYDVEKQIKDPTWIAKAQQLSGESTQGGDALEYADEGVKQQFSMLQREIENLKNQNSHTLEAQQKAMREQQHSQFQRKYANYSPQEIDSITSEMIAGKIQATPEHVYKAFKHDDNVRNAYELGRRDALNGSTSVPPSIAGIQTRNSEPSVLPEENETDRNYMRRVIDNVIKKSQSTTQI